MSAADAAWAERAQRAWNLSLQEFLQLPPETGDLTFVLFDASCVYRGNRNMNPQGEAHTGTVALPNGQSVPAQVTSFSVSGEGKDFMVMALPPIWRAANVQSELTLETLLVAVFVHELTHTRQFAAVNPIFEALDARGLLDENINDDIVQTRFREVPEFVADIDAERELLFRAAAARTDEEARAITREALARMHARRARHYVGADERYGTLEDVFLTMEGVAQWTAYQWLLSPQGGGFTAEFLLPNLRRGGRQWSQDEGLAIFLVVDRLVPDWKARTFSVQSPALAMQLLAEAAR